MRLLCTLLLGLFVAVGSAHAQASAVDAKEYQEVIDKAYRFLKSAQNPDGSIAPKLGGPGVASLVIAGLLRNGKSVDDPVVKAALKYLEASVQKDGGIYNKMFANYSTSVAIFALADANQNKQYDKIIATATKFIKSLQFPDESGDMIDAKAGGVGYNGGPKDRPDLSNTHYFVEALLASGASKDDPAIQQALKFIGRCQNLPGESNPLPFAKKASDDDKGGFTYAPTAGPDSDAQTPAGGLRSAGSMTYAGLKSFLYAGVSKDDPRVKAAVDWVRRHYTLDENPGQGKGGLYYYYQLFAKALDALGEDPFTDAKGQTHAWRAELFAKLKSLQQKDGSWVNSDRRYGESTPELATAYALLALAYVRPKN